MPGIEICRAFFFIHTKKNYFRSNVSEEESRMKNIYLAYFLIIMLSACGGKSSDTVSLSGEIKGLGNDTLYIYGADEMYDRMDTLPVENGKFSKTLSPDTLVAAWLLFSDGSRYPFFMDKGDKIHIKGSAAELNSMEITGNPHNEELTAFQKELKGLGKPSEKVLEEKAGKFINEHHSSLASIYLLDKYFAQKRRHYPARGDGVHHLGSVRPRRDRLRQRHWFCHLQHGPHRGHYGGRAARQGQS